MRVVLLFLALAAVLCAVVAACPEGWTCAEGINVEAARGLPDSWNVQRGFLDEMEAIFLDDEADEDQARATFLWQYAFTSSVDGVRRDVDIRDLVERAQLAQTRSKPEVDLAFADERVVALREVNLANRGPVTTFNQNNLLTMTNTSYQHSKTLNMRVFAVSVTFGSASEPCSPTTVTDVLTGSTSSGSVAQVYSSISSGHVSLTVFNYGSISLPAEYPNCTYGDYINKIDTAVNWASIQDSYEYRWYFIPKMGCSWAGLAQLTPSCDNCWALNNNCGGMVPTHEGGHNQGLSHSGQFETYDDGSDYMGNRNGFRLMNGVKKLRKGYVSPSRIEWDPRYGVFRLTTLDADYETATYSQVILVRTATVAQTIALRSRPDTTFSLDSNKDNRVNVVSWSGSNSVFHFAAAVSNDSTPIPSTSLSLRVGYISPTSGTATTAYLSICNENGCPPYQFHAVCSGSTAVQACVYAARTYPDWFCLATGSSSIPASELGAGKACLTATPANSTDPQQYPEGLTLVSPSESSSDNSALAGVLGTLGALGFVGVLLLCCVGICVGMAVLLVIAIVVIAVVAVVALLIVAGLSTGGFFAAKAIRENGNSMTPEEYWDKMTPQATAATTPNLSPPPVSEPPPPVAAAAPKPARAPLPAPGSRAAPVKARAPLPPPGSRSTKPKASPAPPPVVPYNSPSRAAPGPTLPPRNKPAPSAKGPAAPPRPPARLPTGSSRGPPPPPRR